MPTSDKPTFDNPSNLLGGSFTRDYNFSLSTAGGTGPTTFAPTFLNGDNGSCKLTFWQVRNISTTNGTYNLIIKIGTNYYQYVKDLIIPPNVSLDIITPANPLYFNGETVHLFHSYAGAALTINYTFELHKT